jgi:hypothetical protein
MMKVGFVTALALALAACGKKSETSSAPSCADAVGKAVDAMPAGPTGGEVQAKLKTVMTTRCTEDKWPAAALNCYATSVTDMASMKKCRELLTQDQQTKLMTDIRSVMMGAAGAGGGPMHGGPAPTDTTGSADVPATGSSN